jgi:preprotein translocase subunit YajC
MRATRINIFTISLVLCHFAVLHYFHAAEFLSSNNWSSNMKVGDTIRTVTGRTGVVIKVNGNSLWTTIDCGCWVHITKCCKVAA